MTILFSICAATAWLLFLVAIVVLYRAIRSYSWTQIPAELLQLDIESICDEGTVHWVQIEYRYRVDDREYLSRNVHLVRIKSCSHRRAQTTLARIRAMCDSPEGLVIFYDPANPARSVVFPGFNLGVILFFTLATVSAATFTILALSHSSILI